MPNFLIERNIPGAGQMSETELRAVARKSCDVIKAMDGKVEWLQSHVTDDRIYCLYEAPDEAAVLEHAQLGGFPADRVSRVKRVIGPQTAA